MTGAICEAGTTYFSRTFEGVCAAHCLCLLLSVFLNIYRFIIFIMS